jgi:hypothetical protein
MTQQQFQPQFQPQQGFQQPQTYAPQAQQQFAPQQPTQAPVAASFVPATDPSSWAVGSAQDASSSPVKTAHLDGRTVVLVPLKQGTSITQDGNESRWTQCDVFVLDGPTPFYFGGSPNGRPRIPDTMMVNQLPYFAERTILFGGVLADQLEGQVQNGIAVGKITTKTTSKGNTPWVITTDATDEQLAFANQLIQAQYRHKSFVNPPVTMLAGPQAQGYQQAPQQPQFSQPTQYPQGFGPMGGYAAPVQNGPVPSWPQQPQSQAQFTPPAQPAFQPQFQAPAQPAPADWTLTEILPGMPIEQLSAWQTQTTLDQRLQMLAAAGVTQPTNQVGANGQPPTGL